MTGLRGTVVLRNNGASDLSVSTSGPFSFATELEAGRSYAVMVHADPTGQTCTVSAGTGTVTADVTSVTVSCADIPREVGVVVTGLVGTVVLQNNGGQDLTLEADGAYVFSATAIDGDAYDVTIASQPWASTCAVDTAPGTVSGPVTVTVTCEYLGDFWTLGSQRFDEMVSAASPDGHDPEVNSRYQRTVMPPYASLWMGAIWDEDLGRVRDNLDLFLYGDGSPSLAGTWDMSGETTGAFADLSIVSRDATGTKVVDCSAAAGTLTVTHDNGGLAPMLAEYTVTEWSGIACPEVPTSGTIAVTRQADETYGNPGTQGDSFSVGGTSYSENASTLHDPIAYAWYGGSTTLDLELDAGADLEAERYLHHLEMYIYLAASFDTGGGTYPIDSGGKAIYQSGGLTCIASATGSGSIVLQPHGGGLPVAGVLTVDSWNTVIGSGTCPTTPWTVPFSVTLEAGPRY